MRCTLTPDSFQAHYRVLPYVSRRAAPIHTRASFVVENGQPGAQQAGAERPPAPPSTARVSPAIELDPERIAAQDRADRKN